MGRNKIWLLAKLLEALGLLVILFGLFLSVRLGLGEEGLASMGAEFQALALGGGLFILGWLLESRAGLR